MGIIGMIVGRCHVGDSNRQVIRYLVIGRLEKKKVGWLTWKNLPREHRKKLMRQAIDEHQRNRALYLQAMSGRL